ncbi:hypothetical protein ACKKBG_A37120 [Auxenochlorella protothecoides x Auxenochlorella symbiontica]
MKIQFLTAGDIPDPGALFLFRLLNVFAKMLVAEIWRDPPVPTTKRSPVNEESDLRIDLARISAAASGRPSGILVECRVVSCREQHLT